MYRSQVKVVLSFLLITGWMVGCTAGNTVNTAPISAGVIAPQATPSVLPPTVSLATPTPSVVGQHLATADKILAQGEEVPFEVCGESSTWMRPSEEEQKRKWWSSPRYSNADKERIQRFWTHDFFVSYGFASPEFEVLSLTGLWTLPDGVRDKCFERQGLEAVQNGQKAEVWVLLHKVQRVKRLGTDYAVVVEPVGQGVQFVRFPRPEQKGPLTLYYITQDGQVVDVYREGVEDTWPHRSPQPTAKP